MAFLSILSPFLGDCDIIREHASFARCVFYQSVSISLHICWLPCRCITLTLLAWLLPFVPKVEFGSDPRGVSAKFLQFVAPSVAGSVGNPCQASRSMVAARTRTCTGRWPGQLSRTLRSPWTHRSKWSLMCSKMSCVGQACHLRLLSSLFGLFR